MNYNINIYFKYEQIKSIQKACSLQVYLNLKNIIFQVIIQVNNKITLRSVTFSLSILYFEQYQWHNKQ